MPTQAFFRRCALASALLLPAAAVAQTTAPPASEAPSGSAAQTPSGAPPDAPAASADAAPALSIPPPPPGLGRRQRLSDEDYQRKKERGYFTGLPLANSDPNSGIGFGARVYYFHNGDRSDPFFAYTPYRHRMFLQTFFSTGGLQFHWLDYDAPNLGGSNYRLRAGAVLARNTSANYFGRGERAMADLTYTGAGRSFSHASDYQREIEGVGPDGRTRAFYNKFDIIRPGLLVSLERSMFGGVLRPFIGFGVSYTVIDEYTGDRVNARGPGGEKIKAEMAPSRLREDCDAKRILGCDGGWENGLRLALIYDTRDFEPDPNSGVVAELSSELATKLMGSQYDYARVLGALRLYWSPFPRLADLVLAGRILYEIQTSGTPFFSMNVLPFTEDFRLGLGGVRTLRGYQQDRFVGPVMTAATLEVRWTIGHLSAYKQDFGFIVVPFVDVGRVFDRVSDTTLRDWKRGQGAGLRVAWNQATIAMVDFGFSREDSGLYINFNHIF